MSPVRYQVGDRAGEDEHVVDRQVQPFRSGGGNDVRRVAGQEQPSVLHRLHDEAPHRGDALLDDRTFREDPSVIRCETDAELVPDPIVGPRRDVLVRRHLDVEPADLGRPQAVQREPPVVVRVDQLVGRRRHRGEDPQPRERELPVVLAHDARRDRVARDAVEPVAAGHHVAGDLDVGAVLPVADRRSRRLDLRELDILDLEVDRSPGREPGGDHVLDHFLLAVDPDRPSREIGQRDPMTPAVEAQLDPPMDQRLAIEAVGEARVAQQLDGRLLQDTRPDALLHVLPAPRLQDDGIDARGDAGDATA